MAAAVVEITAREAKPTSRIVFTEGGKGGSASSPSPRCGRVVPETKRCGIADRYGFGEQEPGVAGHFFPEARKTKIHRERGWMA